MDGYSGDMNWSRYTPVDSTTTNYDLFRSAFRNVRFNVESQTRYQITSLDMANLPGLAYKFFGDTSLWRALMAYNGITDPLSGVCVGLTIKVPTKAALQNYVTGQVKSQQQRQSIII
ncbi:peptidoglycan binding protein [Burkholderia phage BcepSauron]|uniref:Peptidoglycan binding protein n=2 Tax=Sarumanvirus TaxID=2843450 RepID=A0A482MKR9_9CAUD|nr:tail sheath [Burkholderia phage BcepSaruman]YP_009904639.1 tail sheath [Burkholderia phage BcepSauron]QBQ74641.1 peptidoglycan binding protein [Burkholderia phage BcepSauron]QBX06671.1 hypothetical protein BcepSaruman_258 [Burkholderia phage BcepSaruman]